MRTTYKREPAKANKAALDEYYRPCRSQHNIVKKQDVAVDFQQPPLQEHVDPCQIEQHFICIWLN